MRIYTSCIEAITDIGREIKKCSTTTRCQTYQNQVVDGNPDFETRELQAFSFVILDTSDKDLMPNLHLEYCRAEVADRLLGEPINPGHSYLKRFDFWKEFLDGNDKFDYTYAERMHWQLGPVITELAEHPETRQAIIEIHDRGIDQDRMGKKRIPCSMYYQLMRRDGKLDMIYTMRSVDFVNHLANDIWMAAAIRDIIAEQLSIPSGKFILFAGSLHTYRKDWEALTNY